MEESRVRDYRMAKFQHAREWELRMTQSPQIESLSRMGLCTGSDIILRSSVSNRINSPVVRKEPIDPTFCTGKTCILRREKSGGE